MSRLITRRANTPVNSYDPTTRTFIAVLASEADVLRTDWDGTMYKERLMCTAAAIDLSALKSGRAALLNCHRRGDIKDQVGVIRDAWIENNLLVIKGEVSDRAEVLGLRGDLANGTAGSMSAGYEITVSQRIRGAAGEPDTIIANKWRPVEGSFVPLPADFVSGLRSGVSSVDTEEIEGGAAVVTPPPAARPPSVEIRAERTRITTIRSLAQTARMTGAELDAAIEDGTPVEAFRTRAMEFAAAQAKRSPTGGVSPGPETDDRLDGMRAAMQEAIYCRISGKRAEGDAREFMNGSLLDLGATLLESRGERTRRLSRDELDERIFGRSGGHTTSDLPMLLTAGANRFLGESYEAAGSPFKKKIARRRTRNDFRSISDVRLSEPPRLLPVGERGEVKHGTRIEEARALYKLKTYSRIFALSREARINDDLNGFGDAMSAFGQGAAETENDLLVELFTANGGAGVTMFDSQPLYHSSHGNIGAGDALSVDSLSAARLALRLMKGLDGKTPINAVAKHLVVGPALETTAEKVLTQLAATKVGDVNPFPDQLQLHVEPRFTGLAWRLFADPAALPTIEVSYLAGHEGPQLSFREGFDTLGVEFRCVLDFGCGVREWRGTYYNPGT